MPDLDQHSYSSLQRTGKDYRNLHKWMDKGQKYLGKDHRSERHNNLYIPYVNTSFSLGSGIIILPIDSYAV